MSKLFSEVYGCYFGIVNRILNNAKDGISKNDIENIVNEHGFSETAFHLLPELLGSEWNFLEKSGDKYFSKLTGQLSRPFTQIELSWIAAILKDSRIRLFLTDERIAELNEALGDVTPIFDVHDFISVDRHLDGDEYNSPVYISNFRKILSACKNNYPVSISYDSGRRGRSQRIYYPYKLSYSELNDKFRLLCAVFNNKTQKLIKTTLNLGRILSVEPSELLYRVSRLDLQELFSEPVANPPVVLEISKERNALERFLLQFASFDRKTEYDNERDVYVCSLSYDLEDETELLVRILSFGPTVKVLGPQSFLDQIKQRLSTQIRLMDKADMN